jgi:hypothetical protein
MGKTYRRINDEDHRKRPKHHNYSGKQHNRAIVDEYFEDDNFDDDVKIEDTISINKTSEKDS